MEKSKKYVVNIKAINNKGKYMYCMFHDYDLQLDFYFSLKIDC